MEGMNFITPMERLKGIGLTRENSVEAGATPESVVPFKTVFENAIDTAKETDRQTVLDTEKLMSGEIEDLHTLGIDSTKAYLSVRLLVEMRNKALDAYNELMRTNL